MTFQNPESVICSITIKTTAGVLTDPATSVTITIYNPVGDVVTNAQAMTKDSTGTYHYDYSPSNAVLGSYRVRYIATDGTRVTIQEDTFELR